jgi:signal peptidase II
VLVLDQLSKFMATLYVAPAGRGGIQVLGLPLYLTYVTNTGAAFGILRDQVLLLAGIALVVIAATVYIERRGPPTGLWIRVALGLQLGGALGNLMDRLRLGYVVDFIDLRWWPVFNLADSAIVIGVAMIVASMIFAGSRSSRAPSTHERRGG